MLVYKNVIIRKNTGLKKKESNTDLDKEVVLALGLSHSKHPSGDESLGCCLR